MKLAIVSGSLFCFVVVSLLCALEIGHQPPQVRLDDLELGAEVASALWPDATDEARPTVLGGELAEAHERIDLPLQASLSLPVSPGSWAAAIPLLAEELCLRPPVLQLAGDRPELLVGPMSSLPDGVDQRALVLWGVAAHFGRLARREDAARQCLLKLRHQREQGHPFGDPPWLLEPKPPPGQLFDREAHFQAPLESPGLFKRSDVTSL